MIRSYGYVRGVEDSKIPWKPLIAVAKMFGMAPDGVTILKQDQLEELFLKAGFAIDYRLEPGETEGIFKGVFIILKKPLIKTNCINPR